jgi:hypothetical protein
VGIRTDLFQECLNPLQDANTDAFQLEKAFKSENDDDRDQNLTDLASAVDRRGWSSWSTTFIADANARALYAFLVWLWFSSCKSGQNPSDCTVDALAQDIAYVSSAARQSPHWVPLSSSPILAKKTGAALHNEPFLAVRRHLHIPSTHAVRPLLAHCRPQPALISVSFASISKMSILGQHRLLHPKGLGASFGNMVVFGGNSGTVTFMKAGHSSL